MPIYEYECPVCGSFETLQRISDAPLKTCPRCAEKGENNSVKKLMSASSFQLKGSGWYKTDYASSSSSGGTNGSSKSHSTKTSSTPTSETSTESTSSPASSTSSGPDTPKTSSTAPAA